MTYDATAQKLAAKVIGTVESGLVYDSINYGDPITVGIAQWFGVRAAAVLNRMRATSHWSGVAPSLDNQLQTIPENDIFWNTRSLTVAEGDTVKPVLLACAAIQIDQLIKDLDVYKTVAIAHGMDPDTNTNSLIFFFTMYHQSPSSALDVLTVATPTGTLTNFYDAVLADPVLGAYEPRYTQARDLILAADVTGIGDPDTTPSQPVVGVGNGGANFTGNLAYIERVGNNLHLHYQDGQVQQAYTDGRGRYMPRAGAVTAPTPAPDPTPPPVGTGAWTHPLPGGVMTSPYGPRAFDGLASFHYGIDFATPAGGAAGTVVAPADMVVTQAGELNASTGWCVKGHTTDNLFTFAFYHMQYATLNVVPGQVVAKGYPLGIEGATGNVTGRHLHFEIYAGNISNPWPPPYGDPVDPAPVLNSHGVTF